MEAADDEGKTCLDYAKVLGDGDRELMLDALTGLGSWLCIISGPSTSFQCYDYNAVKQQRTWKLGMGLGTCT